MNDIPLELKKEFNLEDSEDEKKIDFEKIIIDNKTIIYSTVLYSCALAIGSVIYRLLQSNSFDKLFQSKNTTVSQLFCENICNYMSLFLITVFLAFCLIGYGITKKESVSKIDFKPSIKEFLIYGLAIIICSGVSAVLETLLKSIITI